MKKILLASALCVFVGFSAQAANVTLQIGDPPPAYYVAPAPVYYYERHTTVAPVYYTKRHGHHDWKYWHEREKWERKHDRNWDRDHDRDRWDR